MATELVILDSQHPSARLDHGLTYAEWLETDDTLSTVSVSVTTSGINLGDGSIAPAPAIVGTDVVFWLYGGTSGTTYFGEVTVTTENGRRDNTEWQITIIDPNA
jgi:hypothetical protein